MAYNGWKNRETWLTYLWRCDGADAFFPDGATAAEVEAYVRDSAMDHEPESGFLFDIIEGFFSEVDWEELAFAISAAAKENKNSQ